MRNDTSFYFQYSNSISWKPYFVPMLRAMLIAVPCGSSMAVAWQCPMAAFTKAHESTMEAHEVP